MFADPAARQGRAVHDACAVQPIRDTILALAPPHRRPRAGATRCTTTRAPSPSRARRMPRRRSARSTRIARIERDGRLQALRRLGRAGQGDRADGAPRREPAGWPTRRAISTAPPRPTRTPSPSKTRSPTPSRRTGTTRCGSRSARCGCARASSTRPSRRSAIRSLRVRNNGWALAGLAEVVSPQGRCQRRARGPGGLSRAPGSAPTADPTWHGSDGGCSHPRTQRLAGRSSAGARGRVARGHPRRAARLNSVAAPCAERTARRPLGFP